MEEQVKQAIEEIRPSLIADGGDIEFVSLDEATGTVYVRLTGACSGCPMSLMTLKQGVEAFLVQRVPGVKTVEHE
jgi:Fe-S cluster biogenesis protein NfuA